MVYTLLYIITKENTIMRESYEDVTVDLPIKMYEKLVEYAEKEGKSIQEIAMDAVLKYLSHRAEEQFPTDNESPAINNDGL
jgi:hypothetical protein